MPAVRRILPAQRIHHRQASTLENELAKLLMDTESVGDAHVEAGKR